LLPSLARASPTATAQLNSGFGVLSTEDLNKTKDRTEQDCAIINGQFDQRSLLHQSAKCDQMAWVLATFGLPIYDIDPEKLIQNGVILFPQRRF
jgi:hypothetical protein